jgi:hypothetical protein
MGSNMSDHGDSFLTQYLRYVGDTEAPVFYHRWSAISALGAYLGRQYSFSLGHSPIYTNMYIMLIGEPGSRKSTAIKIAKKIITQAGYDTISADKSSKEKFMLDLAGEGDDSEGKTVDEILDTNLWGKDAEDGDPAEMYIACDEFNDFIGLGNMEFISLLGNLWDYNGVFKNRIKTGKSVAINNPTVSILGGNTSTSFANAFPPDTLGQGFFSRLLLIHGESTGRLITFPELPSLAETSHIIRELQRVKLTARGEAKLSAGARYLLDKIYKSTKPMGDTRFVSYSNRRFTHLLKLCLIISASHYSTIITEEHVVEANTLLTHTEHLMPKALGQFGKAKNSDITHKIMSILNNSDKPMQVKDIWEYVHNDMDKLNDLVEVLRNLIGASKVFAINGGYLSKTVVIEEVNNDMLDYSYLTDEERGMKK